MEKLLKSTEKAFLRLIADYRLYERKRNNKIRKEFEIACMSDKIKGNRIS